MNKSKNYILLYLKGLMVGTAHAIPGVSGGTFVFITGIYKELLYSISGFDTEAATLLFNFRLTDFWKKINGNFLFTFIAGILTSIFFLIRGANYVFQHNPILVWSFCFGVISISSILMLRNVEKWHIQVIVFFLLGAGISYGISTLSPIKSPDNYFILFLAGLLASCVSILPGLSGAFILMLIDKYQYLINARINFNIVAILIFALACLIGLLVSSRILTWVVDNYNNASIALFSGLMVGSLNKIWPWREVLEYVTDNKGDQVAVFDKSMLPSNYFAVTGKDPLIFQAVFMMALGVFLIVLLEKVAERIKTKI